MGVELIISHLPSARPGIRRLLVAHGVISGNMMSEGANCDSQHLQDMATVRAFDSMEDGLAFCEELFLKIAADYHLIAAPADTVPLSDVFKSSLSLPKGYMPDDMDFKSAAGALREFLTVKELKAGERLFSIGDKADELCIVEKGKVVVEIDLMRVGRPCIPDPQLNQMSVPPKLRVLGVGPGGIIGEMDFVLRRPRSCFAICIEDSRLFCLKHDAVERMALLAPHMLNLIQAMLLRATSLSLSHAMQTLERAGREQ